MTDAVVPDISRVMDALAPEQTQMLDHWADQLQELLNTAVSQGGPAARRVKNWLNGVWLGHPLHPALTDAAIGAWSTGAVLDLVGASREADAAMTVGVLAAVPTALAGAADWTDTSEEQRRIGLIHALLNSAALVLMLGSLFARRGNQRGLGIGLSTLGLSLTSISAWLGGELVYRFGTAVSRIAFEPRVDEFVAVTPVTALVEGKLTQVEATVDGQKVPVVLLKRGNLISAISATCPHWGGPLAEGKVVECADGATAVECPWHASQFTLEDGKVCQGPAATPVTSYEVRLRAGQVEVRRRG
ncbi:MAG: nitrite reductase (NAD(P)H) small subunit [Chloroflexi bacterium]|nr:nitrite reductase (NAD(P)H) small subunit [Chloroflexota bacterium]